MGVVCERKINTINLLSQFESGGKFVPLFILDNVPLKSGTHNINGGLYDTVVLDKEGKVVEKGRAVLGTGRPTLASENMEPSTAKLKVDVTGAVDFNKFSINGYVVNENNPQRTADLKINNKVLNQRASGGGGGGMPDAATHAYAGMPSARALKIDPSLTSL